MREDQGSSRIFRVTLSTPLGSRSISVGSNEHLWEAARAAGIVLPAICHQGQCLSCAGKLLQPGEFDSSDAVVYFPEDRAAGFVLLCAAKPRSDLHIQTHAEEEMRRHRLRLGLPAPYA